MTDATAELDVFPLTQDRSADLALAKPPTQRFARIAILAALLLLALYTAIALMRLRTGHVKASCYPSYA